MEVRETLRKKGTTERKKVRQNPRDKTTTEGKEVRLGGKKYDRKDKGVIGRHRVQQGGKSTTGKENVKKIVQKSSKENMPGYKKEHTRVQNKDMKGKNGNTQGGQWGICKDSKGEKKVILNTPVYHKPVSMVF